MSESSTCLKGVVHGKTIELDREPGFPDGQIVEVTVHPIESTPCGTNTEDNPRVESWVERLVFDTTILPGERIVKGTQLAAESLIAEFEEGGNEEEILRAHPELAREDIDALCEYARLPVAFRRSFGAWAQDASELDEFLERNRQQRKLGRRKIDQ